MQKFFILAIVLLFASLGATALVEWNTTMGNFQAEVYEEHMPITVANFISLVNQQFYDGLIFHRVIDGFVIQDGCPLGNGTGGPGYTIMDEYSDAVSHNEAGILSMAKSAAPNSAGSQYFITLAPQGGLDNLYAAFGKVVEGLDAVLAIGQVAVNGERPIVPVTINTVRVVSPQIDFFEPTELTTYTIGNEDKLFILAGVSDYLVNWYVDDMLVQSSTQVYYNYTAPTVGMHTVRGELTQDGYSVDKTWQVNAYPPRTVIEGVVYGRSSLLPFVNVDFLYYLGEEVTAEMPAYEAPYLYPNPANGQSTLMYNLTNTSHVDVDVYSYAREYQEHLSEESKIMSLYSGLSTVGSHSLLGRMVDIPDYGTASSGVYVYDLNVSGISTKRLGFLMYTPEETQVFLRDDFVHQATTDAQGCFRIEEGIPVGEVIARTDEENNFLGYYEISSRVGFVASEGDIYSMYYYDVDITPNQTNETLFSLNPTADETYVPSIMHLQMYPNPFVMSAGRNAYLEYEADASTHLAIYNVKGQKIKDFITRVGTKEVLSWDGRDAHGNAVASGVYFVRLKSQKGQVCRKLLMLK